MTGLAYLSTLVLAQQATGGTKTAPAGSKPGADPATSLLVNFLPFLPVILLFYLMFLRPQQRQEQNRRRMLDSLKRNDRVLTSAGIYGTIVQMDSDNDKVVLRVDDDKGIRLTFSKTSIIRLVDAPVADDSGASSPGRKP